MADTPMSRREVIALMRASTSEAEWNASCDAVRLLHGGRYPDYWYVEIVMSGLLDETRRSWEKANES